MIAEWMRFWCRLASLWVPGMKEGERGTGKESRPSTGPAREANSDKPLDVDAEAAWTPGKTAAAGSDDLTAIKGIGPAIARKLDALGVRTYADLATADPDDLAGRLETRTVTPERVREWIAEARKHG